LPYDIIKTMKVIKIGAVWCSGCLVMKPRWLQTEYLDFDQDEAKIEKLKIEADRLPVFVFLDKKGQELMRLQGEIEKDKLIEIILQNKDK
jgi:hypothetical protein